MHSDSPGAVFDKLLLIRSRDCNLVRVGRVADPAELLADGASRVVNLEKLKLEIRDGLLAHSEFWRLQFCGVSDLLQGELLDFVVLAPGVFEWLTRVLHAKGSKDYDFCVIYIVLPPLGRKIANESAWLDVNDVVDGNACRVLFEDRVSGMPVIAAYFFGTELELVIAVIVPNCDSDN